MNGQIKSASSASKEGSGKHVQEKIMLGLCLIFFGGVLALTLVPQPFNGAAMGLITFLTLVVMFRFN